MTVYGNILKGNPSWPCRLIWSTGRNFVERLLEDELTRMQGKAVKEHNFFSPIDFDQLGKYAPEEPPFLPQLISPDDRSNFPPIVVTAAEETSSWKQGLSSMTVTSASAHFSQYDQKLPQQMKGLRSSAQQTRQMRRSGLQY